ncbi:MAG: carbon monoxide dehydrogenase subunit G [Pigmentiphaga sp.]|uniref:SRPBCC family protein n=1 Tax=Pigmentiphaga sp. TaxID=1977564 RepID=UPI0029AEFBBD|nr:carbon monoxide dehydrogenase subunit G [Pigmentiphaga sp.]MDX3905965.1 carbon monoxide dehydrogenase subunit G [Pigmentiphaga sp.]
MELKGDQVILQTQERVWQALNDPAVLKQCITGCESMEAVSPTEYKAVIMAVVGPVKARFSGKLTIAEAVPPQSYSLSFQGSGGVAGFGKGDAAVSLSPEGKGTRLSYRANVHVGGKLAQIGSRLIEGVGRKLAEDFFATFNQLVGDPALAGAPAVAEEAVPVARERSPSKPVRGGAIQGLLSKPWAWAIGAVAVVVVGVVVTII